MFCGELLSGWHGRGEGEGDGEQPPPLTEEERRKRGGRWVGRFISGVVLVKVAAWRELRVNESVYRRSSSEVGLAPALSVRLSGESALNH